MPRQLKVSSLLKNQEKPTNNSAATYRKTKCPGCERKTGANQNVQFLKETRMAFAKKGLLPEPADNETPQDDALSILSSMGIGIVTKAPKSPNPRSEENTSAYLKTDFSLLKLETDRTTLPNSLMFDSVSFSKKSGEVKFVPMKKLYKPPSELALDEKSNIFKPDNNPTKMRQRKKLREAKKANSNLLTLMFKIQKQQTNLADMKPRLMNTNFKIIMGKEGT